MSKANFTHYLVLYPFTQNGSFNPKSFYQTPQDQMQPNNNNNLKLS